MSEDRHDHQGKAIQDVYLSIVPAGPPPRPPARRVSHPSRRRLRELSGRLSDVLEDKPRGGDEVGRGQREGQTALPLPGQSDGPTPQTPASISGAAAPLTSTSRCEIRRREPLTCRGRSHAFSARTRALPRHAPAVDSRRHRLARHSHRVTLKQPSRGSPAWRAARCFRGAPAVVRSRIGAKARATASSVGSAATDRLRGAGPSRREGGTPVSAGGLREEGAVFASLHRCPGLFRTTAWRAAVVGRETSRKVVSLKIYPGRRPSIDTPTRGGGARNRLPTRPLPAPRPSPPPHHPPRGPRGRVDLVGRSPRLTSSCQTLGGRGPAPPRPTWATGCRRGTRARRCG